MRATDAPNAGPDRPFLVLTPGSWRRLHHDLAWRGRGGRESGAFLLARPGTRKVRAWIAFDDLDPDCLTGGISFAAAGFSSLWELCDRYGLAVVADIHTHPHDGVDQSGIDRANPMIAVPGHIALISPRFAETAPRPAQVGVHVFSGNGQWCRPAPADRATVLRLRRLRRPADPITFPPPSTRHRPTPGDPS